MSPMEALKLRSIMEDCASSVEPMEWKSKMRGFGCLFVELGRRGHACDMFNRYDSNKYVAIEAMADDFEVVLLPKEFAEKVLVLGAVV